MSNWEALDDSHHGETCVVIGNGPSLRPILDSGFGEYDTFGTNRIYLRYVPKYYVSVNPLFLTQRLKDVIDLESIKFLDDRFAFRVEGAYPLAHRVRGFYPDPQNGIYQGYNVTYVCLQLAAFMGYSRVLLAGVDHRYVFEGRPNERKLMEGDDPNHFDPEYFRGMEWNNPDLAKSEEAYLLAKTWYDYHGREIINLTPNSALDVFPKEELNDYL